MTTDKIDMKTDKDKVVPMRRIQPGDLLEVVRQIRRYMATADTTSHLLYASFAEIGPDVQEHAEKARRHVEQTANRLYQLLSAIEKNPIFVASKKQKKSEED